MSEDAVEVRVKAGKVMAVQGPVVDVHFANVDDMPDLHETILTKTFDKRQITLLVAEHLEGNIARCVSLGSTLNLQRKAAAIARGTTLTIPVGEELFGRIINVMGDPIDGKGPIETEHSSPIHRLQSDAARVCVPPFATRVTEMPNHDVAEIGQRAAAFGCFKPGTVLYGNDLTVSKV